jgi:hypothetical protein
MMEYSTGMDDDDRRVLINKPQSDTNGEGESEVTETSTPQANKRHRNRRLNQPENKTKDGVTGG